MSNDKGAGTPGFVTRQRAAPTASRPEPSPTLELAQWLASVHETPSAQRLLLDTTGLMIAARNEPYVNATKAAAEPGQCTALGHPHPYTPADAALINGTAAHGEDFDDTFEGGPVHSGAVLVPALLALAEREDLPGQTLYIALAAGAEILCRMSLVTPKAIHKAGFHPTAVIGAIAAAAACARALALPAPQIASAMGIAGSMASGIIEYLAQGTWTKRMHAGWAAQSGLKAALLARAGFEGPQTVLEGTHGFYKAFAPSSQPDYAPLLDGLGTTWRMQQIAFKPYACGTMTQPFIDVALALRARQVPPADIAHITCNVGEGTVHRLWEPLATKHAPPTPYAAKFSTPYCIAAAYIDGRAGFTQFTTPRTTDPEILALTRRITYEIDPANPYPAAFTGHLRATLTDGQVIEIHQPHMRGGAQAPLSDTEIEDKFMDNCTHGGWTLAQAQSLRQTLQSLLTAPDMHALKAHRA